MYYTTQSRILKIESRSDLDPDWGELQPDNVNAYMISVTPNNGETYKKRYQFITLIPETDTEEDSFTLLDEVLMEFLNEGDRYTVRDFNEKSVEDYISNGSNAPIISFDPDTLEGDQISFLWLVPPKFLMQ